MTTSDQCNSDTTAALMMQLSRAERQQAFLQTLRQIDDCLLQSIALSSHSLNYIELLVQGAQKLFPEKVKPCLVWCDKELSSWRILNHQEWLAGLCNSVGHIEQIPQSLTTFVASPSREFSYEANLSSRLSWSPWNHHLSDKKLENCALVSIPDEHCDWLTMCLFFEDQEADEQTYLSWCLQQYVESLPRWIKALVARRETDKKLEQHIDEQTGLLQPHAFNNATAMMLRDARRYFLRAAFVTVLVNDTLEAAELKLLSDTLRSTLRDNDLLSSYNQREFVMAVRISQLDDAEVVAKKIMTALQNTDPHEVSLLESGIAIGVAFYPEQPDQDRLYLASKAAAEAVSGNLDYRLEYYGKFVHSLDEVYQD